MFPDVFTYTWFSVCAPPALHRSAELREVLRLYVVDAAEVRGHAECRPCGADRQRPALDGILVDHGAMAGQAQLDRLRQLAAYLDLFPDDAEVFPVVPVAILVRIGWVGLVDVQVFPLDAEMVSPKATLPLWPIATPGSAGSPAPITFETGALRCTM
jgi:hypothetical protein